MDKIVAGAERFQKEVFPERKALFEHLVKGQHPRALLVTCSDSRIDPGLITQTEPGELFVIRNAGNIVPPYDATAGHGGGEIPTVEFAVAVLKVPHIIVCGHSHCGAMGALLDPPPSAELPAVRAWLDQAEAARRVVHETCKHIQDPRERLTAAVQQNVRSQLDNLRTHPTVAVALAKQEIQLHGWVYQFETGRIFALDPADNEFLPLDKGHRPYIS